MTYLANFFFNAFDSRPDDSITDSAHAPPIDREKSTAAAWTAAGRFPLFCDGGEILPTCTSCDVLCRDETGRPPPDLIRPRTSPDRLLARRHTRRGQTSNRPFSPVAYKIVIAGCIVLMWAACHILTNCIPSVIGALGGACGRSAAAARRGNVAI